MSEDIRNAQYIQIPESGAIYKFLGTIWRQYDPMVDKITDSNGNVIWGRPSKYLYRKLEYIYFNGAEYINSSFLTTKNFYYRAITFSLARNDARQMPIGMYDGTASNTNQRRFYIADIQPTSNANGARFCIGNTYTTSLSTATYFPVNTKRTLTARTYKSGSNPAMECKILNESGSQLNSQTIKSGSNLSISNKVAYLMACHTINSDSSEVIENYTKGNLYYFEERNTDSSGTYTHRLYPVQRKSDNKCGMYDTVTNTFYPMNGTSTTTAAAGPIVDEYWDMTA